MMVHPERSIRRARRAGSDTSSFFAMMTRPPDSNGMNNSSAAMSKDKVVTASNASVAPQPGFCFMDDSRLTAARCGISTPFGLPVEPDV